MIWEKNYNQQFHKNRLIGLGEPDYYDWLANDKMSQEPRIALLSLLDDNNRHYIKDKFSDTEWKIYSKMLENNVLKTFVVNDIQL